MSQLAQEFEGDGDKGEARGTEDAEDDVGTCEVASARHPDEDEIAQGDKGHGDPDSEQESFRAVENRAGNGGGDKSYDDEQGASDSGVVR